jgi:5'-nucleotidase
LAIMSLVAVSCGSDKAAKSAGSAKATTTTEAEASGSTTISTSRSKTLTILVSNDDGVSAPGIDALVSALAKLPDTTLEISAPSKNQSGQGGKTTPGTLVSHVAATASGHAANSVDGYPADSVIWALDDHGVPTKPQLVMSGTNDGQNLGPVVDFSGTVGAARAGVARGIPALAVSQGSGTPDDYPSSVSYALKWLAEHRAALLAGTEPVAVTNLNVPTCSKGTVRGEVTVPTATDAAGRNALGGAVDCTQTTTSPKDDIDAFLEGYAAFSSIPATSSH